MKNTKKIFQLTSGQLFAICISLILGLFLFNIYSHYIMRRNFKDVYKLILQNPASSGEVAKGDIKVDTKGFPVIGSPEAPLKLVLISDFECPFCEALGTKLLQKIRSEYINRGLVRMYYLSHPLASHKEGQVAARVAWAANKQGKFWSMYDELFSGQDLGQQLYQTAAEKLGLDLVKFNTDTNSTETVNELKRQMVLGDSLNLPGVPAILFNGDLLVGDVAWAGLESSIVDALKERAISVDSQTFLEYMNKPDTIVLDVRTPAEFATGTLRGAINVDVNSGDFLMRLQNTIPINAKVLVYCKSGARSSIAWHLLSGAGYRSHLNLEGGIDAWKAIGNPTYQ
jgi:protein-disulfide isomerase/rhodanese-related sulfurtransferase